MRSIPGGGGRRDATGCYPLFRCRDWSGLPDDLARLKADGLVSLVLVADPLGGAPAGGFGAVFGDLARPWKQHFLVDLDGREPGSAHHRRNARRFLRHAGIEVSTAPSTELDTWCRLYDALVQRHHVTGIARFTRRAFAEQLALPGVLLVKAVTADGGAAGMQLWLTDGDRAWHHLSGYAPAGYRWGGASYALMQASLAELAARGVRTVDLGAGAGL
ncbi:MAG TPA: GNAT family N-acetyltransferase, partial [Candidatus Krumholzibacteria bacterium]|nr:GNAT family N-acetyltransferase [Candidatus Krumholzibacteria bacterium]